jgi:hypothetical protein
MVEYTVLHALFYTQDKVTGSKRKQEDSAAAAATADTASTATTAAINSTLLKRAKTALSTISEKLQWW